MFRDKKILIAIVVVIVLLFGGGWYVMGVKNTKTTESMPLQEDTTVQTLSPASIGLDLVFRKDGKAAKIVIANAKGIKAIEYQISYQKKQEGEDVPEGLIGDIDMTKVSGTSVETDFREFGTCSSGTCRYDNVTSPIKITLKITKDNGKVYQSEKSFDLPQ